MKLLNSQEVYQSYTRRRGEVGGWFEEEVAIEPI